jgi:2-amino-4-hydroxy-6-hydroxymethyldihydropteridine diphosphokinase
VRAYIALGSNLSDPVAQVRAGAQALGRLPGTRLVCCSALYRTAPVGVTDQPDFINAACAVDTTLPPAALMQALLAIEQAHGRQRDIPTAMDGGSAGREAVSEWGFLHWTNAGAVFRPGGPRTLDLDLLLYGDQVCHEPGLILPHPRLHERAFVLYPLSEIAPGLSIPGHGQVETLLAGCAGQAIERLAAGIEV